MTNLEQALTRALMEIIIWADQDSRIPPDAALALVKPVATLLKGLQAEDRNALTGLIMQYTVEESDPDRIVLALEMPDILGLPN